MNNLILGAGYIGSALFRKLPDWKVATRATWKDFIGEKFDVIINCACPASRYRAAQNPQWDFNETVQKTFDFYTLFDYRKFIQISSISARSQRDTFYGRSKLAAESLIDQSKHLIVRLTSTYDDSLSKGVIYDIIHDNPIYLSTNSCYNFASLDYVAQCIVNNLDKTGLGEIGGRDSITLKDLCGMVDYKGEFKSDYIDFQTTPLAEKIAPGLEECVKFIKRKKNEL